MPRERHGDDRLVLTVAARGRRAGSGRPGAHPRGDAETVASHTRHHRELNAAHRAHQPPVSPRSCCLRRRDRLPRSVHRRRLSRDAGPRPIDHRADSTQPAQFPGRQARRCGRLACGVGLAPNATGSQRVEPVLPQARPCRSGRPRSPVRRQICMAGPMPARRSGNRPRLSRAAREPSERDPRATRAGVLRVDSKIVPHF